MESGSQQGINKAMHNRPLSAPPGPYLLPEPPRRRRGCGGCLLRGIIVLALAVVALHFGLLTPFGTRRAATTLVVGADQPQGGAARSDTILLVRVSLPPQPRVVVVSLPRDTRVHIPGKRGWRKLNAAFAHGGLDLTRQTLTETFNVAPDHHVVLYSEGLAAVVDALGGVPVEVPRRMDYDDRAQDLHIHLKPGFQTLNGTQAVGFVRFRSDGRGDLGRIERQQVFVRALVKHALRPRTLLRLGPLWKAARRAVETDLRLWQLLGLGYSLRKLPPEGLQTKMLPGRSQYIGGVSYYVAATEDVERLMADD
jgi:LCP family protein required for cell wall assembly